MIALSGSSYGAHAKSQFTFTSGTKCASVSRDRETGDTVKRCPGIGGFSLLILNSDDRASISVITPDKTTVPLNFWDVVTPTFSTLGPRIEWQMASVQGKQKPVAIVARISI